MLAGFIFPLFLFCIAIQLGYVLYYFSRVYLLSNSKFQIPNSSDKSQISVIICARNEARNLEQNLPAILGQRYTNASGKPAYEVIVVNDASTDDTEQILYKLSQLHEHLWHVTIPADVERNLPGKKYALSKGLEHAAHDIIVMTDADCLPASENWLTHMAAPFAEGKEIAVGVGRYKKESSLLNSFIRWETMHSFLQSASMAMDEKPYMAVGRNLACTKAALMQAQASDTWSKLPSGDDDLLMRAMANENNTAVINNPGSFTLSDAKKTLPEYLSQKRRHMSTGKYYKAIVKAVLAGYAVSHAIVWLCFFALLFTGFWQLALALMLCRCVVYYMLWHHTSRRLQEKFSIAGFLLGDAGWLVYNFVLAPYIIWKNKQQWI